MYIPISISIAICIAACITSSVSISVRFTLSSTISNSASNSLVWLNNIPDGSFAAFTPHFFQLSRTIAPSSSTMPSDHDNVQVQGNFTSSFIPLLLNLSTRYYLGG
uniref:ORF2 n=1 Tax=Leptolyngbya foveolarum TaxID=47253 RepID=Q51766_9CYAN|nr:ORF2 [Leptolyngbya foveolarum]